MNRPKAAAALAVLASDDGEGYNRGNLVSPVFVRENAERLGNYYAAQFIHTVVDLDERMLLSDNVLTAATPILHRTMHRMPGAQFTGRRLFDAATDRAATTATANQTTGPAIVGRPPLGPGRSSAPAPAAQPAQSTPSLMRLVQPAVASFDSPIPSSSHTVPTSDAPAPSAAGAPPAADPGCVHRAPSPPFVGSPGRGDHTVRRSLTSPGAYMVSPGRSRGGMSRPSAAGMASPFGGSRWFLEHTASPVRSPPRGAQDRSPISSNMECMDWLRKLIAHQEMDVSAATRQWLADSASQPLHTVYGVVAALAPRIRMSNHMSRHRAASSAGEAAGAQSLERSSTTPPTSFTTASRQGVSSLVRLSRASQQHAQAAAAAAAAARANQQAASGESVGKSETEVTASAGTSSDDGIKTGTAGNSSNSGSAGDAASNTAKDPLYRNEIKPIPAPPSWERLADENSFVADCRKQTMCYFYHVVDAVVAAERRRSEASAHHSGATPDQIAAASVQHVSSILSNADIMQALFFCAAETVLHMRSLTSMEFPRLMHEFKIDPFGLFMVLEQFIKAESTLPGALQRHLVYIEEQLLQEFCWAEFSSLHRTLARFNVGKWHNQNGKPTGTTRSPGTSTSIQSAKLPLRVLICFRKVKMLIASRIEYLSNQCELSPAQESAAWTTAKHMVEHHPELLYRRHLDHIVLCCVYAVLRLSKDNVHTFQTLINMFDGFNPDIRSLARRVHVRGSTTDIIEFYNTVFIRLAKSFVMKFRDRLDRLDVTDVTAAATATQPPSAPKTEPTTTGTGSSSGEAADSNTSSADLEPLPRVGAFITSQRIGDSNVFISGRRTVVSGASGLDSTTTAAASAASQTLSTPPFGPASHRGLVSPSQGGILSPVTRIMYASRQVNSVGSMFRAINYDVNKAPDLASVGSPSKQFTCELRSPPRDRAQAKTTTGAVAGMVLAVGLFFFV